MKLITMLGTGSYKNITYDVFGTSHYTCYFPAALAKALNPISVSVLLTNEARERHWNDFRAELKQQGFSSVEPIPIPSGVAENELWEIFNAITDHVDEEEEVIFDITHSYRSIPIIILLSIAFLKVVKNCRLKGLYYGAYDAKISTGDGMEIAPAFDLTPFIVMLDWIQGAYDFKNYGEAGMLADILQKIQKKAILESKGEIPSLGSLGSSILNITRTLKLNRTRELVSALNTFIRILERKDIITDQIGRFAAPMLLLLDHIRESFSSLIEGDFTTQAVNLVAWHVAHGNNLQAISYMRELIVSKTMLELMQMDEKDQYCLEKRQDAEQLLNRLSRQQKSSLLVPRLWSRISQLRNDMNHCGFRQDCAPASGIVNKMERLLAEFTYVVYNRDLWLEILEKQKNSEVRILLSPLGLSPGVLFTVLKVLKPHKLVVVTTRVQEKNIANICGEAGYSGACFVYTVEDPFTSFKQGADFCKKIQAQLERWEVNKADLMVNITGGTTALQFLVQQAAEHFSGIFNCRVTLYAAIDRRARTEQEKEPYVLGEVIALTNN